MAALRASRLVCSLISWITLTTLPISSERAASDAIFSETEVVAAAIFSMVAAAVCITAPPLTAVSAEPRLAPAALSAL